MTQTDRQRWDQRYRTGAYAERPWPSAYLQQCIPQIAANPVAARALDVACGRGRNSLYLAQQGLADTDRVKRRHIGANREPVDRWRGDDGEVANPGQGELQGPRNRRRSERQNVYVGA